MDISASAEPPRPRIQARLASNQRGSCPCGIMGGRWYHQCGSLLPNWLPSSRGPRRPVLQTQKTLSACSPFVGLTSCSFFLGWPTARSDNVNSTHNRTRDPRREENIGDTKAGHDIPAPERAELGVLRRSSSLPHAAGRMPLIPRLVRSSLDSLPLAKCNSILLHGCSHSLQQRQLNWLRGSL